MSLDFSAKAPRNPMFLHPALLNAVEQIITQTEASLGPAFEVRIISTLRTPSEQFNIFKQGRVAVNGIWQKAVGGRTVTHVDGFDKRSNHNYQPSQACDFGIFDSTTGAYLTDQVLYNHLGAPTREAGFTWGGDWNSFKDRPHIEIPKSMLFGNSRVKGSGIVWQIYLQKAGTYTGELDGIFGPMSEQALMDATGTTVRNRDSYRKLFEQFGKLSLEKPNSQAAGMAA